MLIWSDWYLEEEHLEGCVESSFCKNCDELLQTIGAWSWQAVTAVFWGELKWLLFTASHLVTNPDDRNHLCNNSDWFLAPRKEPWYGCTVDQSEAFLFTTNQSEAFIPVNDQSEPWAELQHHNIALPGNCASRCTLGTCYNFSSQVISMMCNTSCIKILLVILWRKYDIHRLYITGHVPSFPQRTFSPLQWEGLPVLWLVSGQNTGFWLVSVLSPLCSGRVSVQCSATAARERGRCSLYTIQYFDQWEASVLAFDQSEASILATSQSEASIQVSSFPDIGPNKCISHKHGCHLEYILQVDDAT